MFIMRYIFSILFVIICSSALSQEAINIWKNSENKSKDVTLTPFIPDNPNGVVIIVCPGGSYCWLDYETEGVGVAKWLNTHGITAFVLQYRVAGVWSYITHDRLIVPRNQHPAMISDIQRAIQWVRENSSNYPINPNKLGVMGFSAGGHLAMSSAVFHRTNFLNQYDITCNVSLKPNFVAPIYPVVTMSNKNFVHKRSRRGLLGEWKKAKSYMKDSLSLEKNIPNDCPPVFLMNCKDDPVVKYQNSELLDSALSAKGINHKYIQYETGGHGFGANPLKTSTEAINWRNEFIKWLNQIII